MALKSKEKFFHLLFFHSDSTISYLIAGVVILAVAAGAFFGGYDLGQKRGLAGQATEPQKQGQAGEKATSTPFEFSELFSLGGKVKEVGAKTISFETQIAPNPQPEIRKAIITKDTAITKFEIIKTDGKISGRESKIKLSDIRAGDTIVAVASENIKDKKIFTAAKIQLLLPPIQ